MADKNLVKTLIETDAKHSIAIYGIDDENISDRVLSTYANVISLYAIPQYKETVERIIDDLLSLDPTLANKIESRVKNQKAPKTHFVRRK